MSFKKFTLLAVIYDHKKFELFKEVLSCQGKTDGMTLFYDTIIISVIV